MKDPKYLRTSVKGNIVDCYIPLIERSEWLLALDLELLKTTLEVSVRLTDNNINCGRLIFTCVVNTEPIIHFSVGELLWVLAIYYYLPPLW